MNKRKKIILNVGLMGSLLVPIGSISAVAMLSMIPSATTNNSTTTNNDIRETKYLGMVNGEAKYQISNSPVLYNGYYYSNAEEAANASVAGNNNQGNGKFIITDENYIGDANCKYTDTDYDYGILGLDKDGNDMPDVPGFLTKLDDPNDDVIKRMVDIYENPKNNVDGAEPEQKYTTSYKKAQEWMISNIHDGLNYSDGFGNLFKSYNEAKNSANELIRNQITKPIGYYPVESVAEGKGTIYNINPFNKYDQTLLKRIAIDNLCVPDSGFKIDLFNKKELQQPSRSSNEVVFVPSYDEIYNQTSTDITYKLAEEFSSFISEKLRPDKDGENDNLVFNMNLNPTWESNWDLGIDARWGVQGANHKHLKVHMYTDQEKDNSDSYIHLYCFDEKGSYQSMNWGHLTYNAFTDMVQTFTDRIAFEQKFQITDHYEPMYTGYQVAASGFRDKPAWEEAKLRSRDGLHGRKLYGFGVSVPDWDILKDGVDPVKYQRYPSIDYTTSVDDVKDDKNVGDKLLWENKDNIPIDRFQLSSPSAQVKGWPKYNHNFCGGLGYKETNGFRFLDKSCEIISSTDPAFHQISSAIAFDIRAKAVLKNPIDYSAWAREFANQIKGNPLFYNKFMTGNTTNIDTICQKLFVEQLQPYINTNILGKQFDFRMGKTRYLPYLDSNLGKLIPLPDGRYKFENEGSWVFDFLNNSGFFGLKNSYIEKSIYDLRSNIQSGNTCFVITYKGAPLYMYRYDAISKLGLDSIFGMGDGNSGIQFNPNSIAQTLKAALANPNLSQTAYEGLVNISNKLQIRFIGEGNNKKKIFTIPDVNLDVINNAGKPEFDKTNDVNFLSFDPNELPTTRFKKIQIPEPYKSNVDDQDIYKIDGSLLISKKDPISMLDRPSGIYTIANFYNSQIDEYYKAIDNLNAEVSHQIDPEKPNEYNKDLLYSPAPEDQGYPLYPLDDVPILFNVYDNPNPGDKINDALNISRYGEIIRKDLQYNLSLNAGTGRQVMHYEQERDEYFESRLAVEPEKVYIYYDNNNVQLNKNIFNDEESAKKEALSNVSIFPSKKEALLVDKTIYDNHDPNIPFAISDGKIITKNPINVKKMDLSRVSINSIKEEILYFRNYKNAFNYVVYLIDKYCRI